jgi:hypothetical protein
MTTFSYPLNIKTPEPLGPDVVSQRQARVSGRYSVVVGVAQTGTAIGTTTIPLFVAPAGSSVYEATLDITTGFDNLDTNFNIGTAAAPTRIKAATSVNTARRQNYAPTAAQISVNAIPFTVDTTIQAVVSIATSTVSAGSVIVHVQII